jgi:hypothetical protein
MDVKCTADANGSFSRQIKWSDYDLSHSSQTFMHFKYPLPLLLYHRYFMKCGVTFGFSEIDLHVLF